MKKFYSTATIVIIPIYFTVNIALGLIIGRCGNAYTQESYPVINWLMKSEFQINKYFPGLTHSLNSKEKLRPKT